MPSINRIRVNNVKYNFGTQQYDDFSMRMYGKNTLYDLANGGGKSILMLLLLQNLIPNCTLDDKQPIEKLFRTGSGNTTIHSLIEWKLDESDIKDGYRYMTTGFCARRAKDSEETEQDKSTAAVEYFNYCIFYREYNRNDIVNLPLSKGNEKITFTGLKSYLKELSHKDMGLEIRIFDRKGEYQRFISGYGLHESHWEIIRGINKTEGHVRTYFETNYKTTRKVVEDLLIEEIIEKAFLARTGKDGEDDTMALTLLDIKDKLNVLAQKKRDIADFDHQIELINVLQARVNNCIGFYEEYQNLCERLADVYVTGKSFAEHDKKQLQECDERKNEAYRSKELQKKRLESLKITRDRKKLKEINNRLEDLNTKLAANERKIEDIRYDINMKESVNDYLGYLENRRQLQETQLIIDNITNKIGANQEKLAAYAYNRKIRDEKRLAALLVSKEEIEKNLDNALMEQSYSEKCLKEGEIARAVADSDMADASEKITDLNNRIGELSLKVALLAIGDAADVYEASEQKRKELETELSELEALMEQNKNRLFDDRYELTIKENALNTALHQLEQYSMQAEEYRHASKQFADIMTVYGVEEPTEIVTAIDGRIETVMTDIVKKKLELEALNDRKECLKGGSLFEPGIGAKKVMDYIFTRHNVVAIYGAEYLSVLSENQKAKILEANPGLPYGVVVKEFEKIAEDATLCDMDTGNEMVFIYDMNTAAQRAVAGSSNVIMAGRGTGYFTNPKTIVDLKQENEGQIQDLQEELSLICDKLKTYREDLSFVSHLVDNSYMEAEENERECNQTVMNLRDDIKELKAEISELTGKNLRDEERQNSLKSNLRELENDTALLLRIGELTELLKDEESRYDAALEKSSSLKEVLENLSQDIVRWTTTANEETARLKTVSHNMKEIENKWMESFAAYEDNTGKEFALLDLDDETLEAEFMAMAAVAGKQAPDIEDKKKLKEALSGSMERILKGIEKRGIAVSDIEAKTELYVTEEEALNVLENEVSRLTLISAALSQEIKNSTAAGSRLEGSIEYAMTNLTAAYGESAYVYEEMSMAEAENAIANGDSIMKELEEKYQHAKEAYDACDKEQGVMLDLYKDVKRIVDSNSIDVAKGRILTEGREQLRQIFEDSLLKYDRSRKNLEKTRNELMRFKGQTAEALSAMGVFEMANTIRTDVVIPENYYDAKALLSNLIQIVDYIRLEKERVEKGIEDMVSIKESFCTQCLQRCMDVKTELEKLPKLSKITMGQDIIKMVDLSIPYVKEEFYAQRMSDYIDEVVKGADAYEDDRKRVRYIRDCLALKRLFGVLVTDMNSIKLNLYKRERVKEQSRYLKYEEAVGSTGQSQGIYIQFLVAIINYIAGMYSYTGEEQSLSKTIFIDNPFGAAKDIYIWEPIFAMLAANNVQLIVPARGATPAITGRFDVNYILGQQMVGGKQQTVVIDYTSKTNNEELEYNELTYEQATFDFI